MKALEVLENIYQHHGPVETGLTLSLGETIPPEKFLQQPDHNRPCWHLSECDVTVKEIAEAIIELREIQQKGKTSATS